MTREQAINTLRMPSWSEEDEKMRDSIIDILNRTFSVYSALGTSTTRPSCPTYKDEIDWLKSLRPQPKQEKSDYITPHKQFFKWIYDRLVSVHKENPDADYMLSFKQRIEELSFDNPSWKPSAQELGALKTAVSVLTEERTFPKAAEQIQKIIDVFDGKELRKDCKPSEELIGCLERLIAFKNPEPEDIKGCELLLEQLKKL